MRLSFGAGSSVDSCSHRHSMVQSLSKPRPPTTIHCLPDEILAYIFLFSCHDCDPVAVSRGAVLYITHVCSRWRQLALSLGELWAFLVVSFPITPEELDRTKTWLGRSEPYPLHITVDVRDPDWDFNEESHPVQWFEMQATMGVILPEIERWKEMKIYADNWAPLHAFLYYTRNTSAPLLQDLVLQRCNPYFSAPDQRFAPSRSRDFLPLFGNQDLEELKAVELEGVHVDWASSLPLRGLTRLSFGYHAEDVLPSLDEFRDLLLGCPELDSLAVMGWGPRLSRDSHERKTKLQQFRGTLLLPRLRNLELGVMIPSYTVDFLSLFTIPSLEMLTLDGITRYDPKTLSPPHFGSIFDFLSRQASSSPLSYISTHSLSSLTIMNLNPGEEALRSFLFDIQELRALTIQNCDASALTALIPNNVGTPGKDLARLFVESCDPDVLAKVLWARRSYQSPAITDITFRQNAQSGTGPLLPEMERRFAQLNVKVAPSQQIDHFPWRKFEVDDSEDLVAAILDEGGDT
ncbi:hypothetical protein P691DRAFT_727645 [Macrolepiota fuliginosa MF-IS2]|uniref:F-box domain-containing protein n=1 Tax=Macrolepiota fuliginosa MF-IS2 TaxID=1400762 RepID=A0A9P5XG61_9AGAR|nr:hypothetical protein P691DRAFT_727645 [Macrolepiota fuliginosa MF-IS2]